MASEEERLLRRLAQHEHGICLASLSEREKTTANLLQDFRLARYDVALCITEAGQQALADRPAHQV